MMSVNNTTIMSFNRLKAQQLPSNHRSHGAGHWPQNATTALLLQGTYNIDHLSGSPKHWISSGKKNDPSFSRGCGKKNLGILFFGGDPIFSYGLQGPCHHRSLMQPMPSEPSLQNSFRPSLNPEISKTPGHMWPETRHQTWKKIIRCRKSELLKISPSVKQENSLILNGKKASIYIYMCVCVCYFQKR